MDTALQDPGSISVCSDNDAYNTENARVHFGPLRSPERKFAAMEESLEQLLTSDTVPPPDPIPIADENKAVVEDDNATEDNEDEDRVEELVGGAEDDEGNGQDDEIPFSADYVDDEPSSALALRISCASGNPSPPPSPTRPTTNLAFAEPTATEGSPPEDDITDGAGDVELQVADIFQPPSEVPPASQSPSPSPPKDDQDMEVDTVLPTTPSAQPDLISFDPFTPLRIPPEFVSSGSIAPDSAISAVDALLLHSDDTITLTTNDVVHVPSINGPSLSEPEGATAEGPGATDSVPTLASPEPSNAAPTSQTSVLTPPSQPVQQLRRSPRKSVALATAALSTPQGPITPRRSTSASHSPKKKKLKVDSEVEESQDESDVPMDNNTLHPVQQTPMDTTPRPKDRSRSPLAFSREVGSLSPETTNLLSELVPSFTDRTPLELNAAPVAETSGSSSEPVVTAQGMQTFSVFSAPLPEPLPSTPKGSTSPIRPLETPSPSKFRLQVSVPQAVPETPARRITIEQALETGQISPLKASQLGLTPGTKGVSSNPSIPQTPARRVLVTDKEAPSSSSAMMRAPGPPSPVKQAPRFGTPARQEPRAHAPTVSSANTSRPGFGMASFARPTGSSSASAAPSVASSSSSGGKTSKLPYPLVGAEKPSSTSSTSKDGDDKLAAPISSPVKSSLKQPTSRIPRIGAKPYARPAAAPKPAVPRQAPVPAPPAAPAAQRPVVMRKVDMSKPSTTKMVNKVAPRAGPSSTTVAMAKGTGKEPSSVRSVVPASSSSNGTSSSTTSGSIKRKRSPDTARPAPASPVKSRMPPRAAKTAAVAAVAAASKPIPLSSLTRPAPAPQLKQPRMIRKVVDPPPPPAPPAPPPAPVLPESQPQPPPAEQPQPESGPPPKPSSPPLTSGPVQAPPSVFTAPVFIPPPMPELDALGSPMKEDTTLAPNVPPPQPAPKSRRASLIPLPTPVVLPTIQIDPPAEHPPIETLPPQEVPVPSGVRRTTRQRKSVDPAPEPAVRATSRRKASQGPRLVFTDAYSEMSATALKQLTNTNTMRNQHYLSARLELEVVKRDGLRPESPMVKIKTVAQRQAEEQSTRRAERAERRARMSGESMPGSSDLEMDSDEEDQGGELPQWEEPQAHVRGAGEDEDYKTPDRAFRRMKLTEDGMQDVEMNEKRRVKWDRGLFTVVYIDEVQLGSRQVDKENKPEKGCLTPKAKSLRLDTLGNLGGVDEPLPELIPQHVTVKKFVYDGEVIEPVVVAPPPPPPVPKVTRSRSRKSKS